MTVKDTKDMITDAALRLFADRGYAETSMSSIAEEAGVSKGTLYLYFSSKEEMFREMIETGFEVMLKQIGSLVKKDRPVKELVYDYIRISHDFCEENKEVSRIIADNFAKVISDEFKERMDEQLAEMLSYLRILIERGIKEGVFKTINTEFMLIYLLRVVTVFHERMFMEMKITPEEKIDTLYKLIMRGIEKG
ncbi:TetR/AcrR family transcriptional regulator [Halocella sp. SP3-1]|uniref:TetR/AcrR family transcriptional regulator n=1 Tax=Halocella sp. SP3-1 TaxID=2382161 RepID=UPI000F75FF7A|nr:TetR/AcrR family transcriptional regulator [Halocella sp. SP3-1]AZO95878.1 TetR/AcrR family transcriptional regulator [Halocella sp. SP3-1]